MEGKLPMMIVYLSNQQQVIFIQSMDSSSDQLLPSKSRVTYRSKAQITLIVLNIALSSFYFGYSIAYFGQLDIDMVLDLIGFEIDSSTAKGLFNGCIPVGALFGALSSSFLIKIFSRRQSILVLNGIAIVVGGMLYIENFYSLLLFRLLQGFVVGAYSAISPLYINQIAPNEISGTLGSYTQLLVCFGCFFSVFFAYILKKVTGDDTGREFWQILYGFTLITLVIQTVVLLFVFPYETPKYLLLKRRDGDARRLIDILYKEEYANQIFEQKKADISGVETQRDVVVQSIISQDSAPKNRSKIPVVIAIHLAALQQISGINAFVIYGGQIASKTATGELPALMPSIINFQQVLGTFITGFLLIKFGRKTILQIGTLGASIGNVLIFIGFLLNGQGDDDSTTGQPFILLGLFLYMGVFGISLGPIVWLYIPEIVDPKVVPFSTATNWISASLIIMLFPIMTEHLLNDNPALLFAVFAVWCIASFVLHLKYVVETKDKSERLIQEEYSSLKMC